MASCAALLACCPLKTCAPAVAAAAAAPVQEMASRVALLTAQNAKMAQELAEYKAESADLKNQGERVRGGIKEGRRVNRVVTVGRVQGRVC